MLAVIRADAVRQRRAHVVHAAERRQLDCEAVCARARPRGLSASERYQGSGRSGRPRAGGKEVSDGELAPSHKGTSTRHLKERIARLHRQ